MKINFLKHTQKSCWKVTVVIALLMTILFSSVSSTPVHGQLVEVEFGETVIENRFPEAVRFTVKIDRGESRGDIEFWYKMGAMNWEEGEPNCRGITENNVVDYFNCTFLLDLKDMPPQLPIMYKWEVADPYGTALVTSEEKTFVYTDPAYTWETLSSDDVTIWWHDQPKEFGERAFNIAKTAIKNQSKLYGMELLSPIQIVIENSQDEFTTWNTEYTSLESELAYYRLGLTIQVIEPETEPQWRDFYISDFIPRGISYLYFFEASGRKQKSPPEWLEAGFAKYNELHIHEAEWASIRTAVNQDKLIPLSELRDDFNVDDDQLFLVHAECYSAIEYLLSVYGEEKLHILFENYRTYKTSDEAFEAAFGKNVAEVEADWEVWVKEHPKVTSLSNKLQPYIPSILIITIICSFLVFAAILGFIIFFSRRKQSQPNP